MAKNAAAKKRHVRLAVTRVRFLRNPAGTRGATARRSCSTKSDEDYAAGQQGKPDRLRAPGVGPGRDESVDDPREPSRAEDRPCDVGSLSGMQRIHFGPTLVHHAAHCQYRNDGHWHIDEEDPAPGTGGNEQARNDRA